MKIDRKKWLQIIAMILLFGLALWIALSIILDGVKNGIHFPPPKKAAFETERALNALGYTAERVIPIEVTITNRPEGHIERSVQ